MRLKWPKKAQKPISRSQGSPSPTDWSELFSRPGVTVQEVAHITPGVPERKVKK